MARQGPNLVVEIKGYRGEDAKEKKSTMDNYWVPGVNRPGSHGRWAFAEFTDVYAMQHDLADRIEEAFDGMIGRALRPAARPEGHAHRAERRPE